MKDFSHVSDPLRLHQGTKALERLAREMDRAGCARALIITGATLGQDNPVLRRLQEALGAGWSASGPASARTAPYRRCCRRQRRLARTRPIALWPLAAVRPS